jgi:hypothetical protein
MFRVVQSIRALGALLGVLFICQGAAAQWSAPQLLSSSADWANGARDMKDVQLQPASGGGFHATWFVAQTHQVRYRRIYGDGTLGPVMAAADAGSNLTFNPQIAELGDGTVQIVWEHWIAGQGAEVGVTKLAPGANSFTPLTQISNSGLHAKFPLVAGFGLGASKKSVVTYYNSSTKELRSLRNNGTGTNGSGFGGDNYLGQHADSEYVLTGLATSPLDGSVWKGFGTQISNGVYRINICRFDPDTQLWENKIEMPTTKTGFFSRIGLDVNDSGHVMVAYDSVNSTTGRIYSPESGSWGAEMPLFTSSFFGNVAAVPGTNNFYVFNTYNQDFPMVRPVLNETFNANLSEYPGAGTTANSYIPNGKGAVDSAGRAYMAWEYWADSGGGPQIYFSSRTSVNGFSSLPEPATAGIVFGTLVAARRRAKQRG